MTSRPSYTKTPAPSTSTEFPPLSFRSRMRERTGQTSGMERTNLTPYDAPWGTRVPADLRPPPTKPRMAIQTHRDSRHPDAYMSTQYHLPTAAAQTRLHGYKGGPLTRDVPRTFGTSTGPTWPSPDSVNGLFPHPASYGDETDLSVTPGGRGQSDFRTRDSGAHTGGTYGIVDRTTGSSAGSSPTEPYYVASKQGHSGSFAIPATAVTGNTTLHRRPKPRNEL